MFVVVPGILSVIMDSIASSLRKKALDIWRDLSNISFKLFVQVFGLFSIPLVIFIFWFDKFIFNNHIDLVIIFFIYLFWGFNTLLNLSILKVTKMSELLPYNSLDKLFIIVIWFFLFYWTQNGSSLTTLLISILTLFVIIAFTIDFKNLKIPKTIWLYIVHKLINAWIIIATWYMLIKYTSVTMISVSWFFELIIFVTIWIILKNTFSTMLTQEAKFYANRFWASLFWWTAFLISLTVLKEAWVVVATLLWFASIVFLTFSMKFILNDNPSNKQIIMSFIVLALIWIWYYFK